MLILKKDINSLTEEEYDEVISRIPQKKVNEISVLRREDDKKRSVCGCLLAFRALGEFLGCDEKNVTFSYDENGRPVSENAFLSISHAGDFAVCAVSDKPVGIDAEVLRRIKPRAALRVCTENELRYIFGENADRDNLPDEADEETSLRFLEIWTKKEAYGKMLGCGILYEMDKTDVSHIKTKREGNLIISFTQKEV